MGSRQKITGIDKITLERMNCLLKNKKNTGVEVVDEEEPIRVKRNDQWVGGDAEKPDITKIQQREF